MSILRKYGRIDFTARDEAADPRLSTGILFTENRGQMFGTLLCETPDNKEVVLRAFSGQYNGVWEVDGWVPPVLNTADFAEAVDKADPQIKRLTEEIGRASGEQHIQELIAERRALSRNHMAEIHAMYRIKNFSGEESDLFSIFGTSEGRPYSIPAGTGDCCAPKLLNTAIMQGLTPLSLAEFFWGKTSRSGNKLHGHFYPPCSDKCGPLLGFMLRGSGLKLSVNGDGFGS